MAFRSVLRPDFFSQGIRFILSNPLHLFDKKIFSSEFPTWRGDFQTNFVPTPEALSQASKEHMIEKTRGQNLWQRETKFLSL